MHYSDQASEEPRTPAEGEWSKTNEVLTTERTRKLLSGCRGPYTLLGRLMGGGKPQELVAAIVPTPLEDYPLRLRTGCST